ncbi:zinc ribbon domain-containing protein [Candidatus Bathyarchaeota archaeon]|nr:zinc ribbon domain-containing protein [Candidatus Bathyarchaeota archaeon]RJS74729.1 MAG: zinc ribbon domain-containing protein [Candidatus Bathyarchaeota archaeon]
MRPREPRDKSTKVMLIAGIVMIASVFVPWTMIIGESNYYRKGAGFVKETFTVFEFPLVAYIYYTMNGEVTQGWIEIFPVRSIAAVMVFVSGLLIMRVARRRKTNARMLTIAVILGLAAPTLFASVDNVTVSLLQASDFSQSYSIIPLGVVLPIVAGGIALYHILKELPSIEAAPPTRIPGVYMAYRCPVCGYPITRDYLYCPNCGSRIPREITG